MEPQQMRRLFEAHRDAEARRDFGGILATFAENCYLETVPLGIRAQGHEATKAAYVGYFTAFPDLAPEDEGFAYGDDVLVTWGHLSGTSGGEWLGIRPSGLRFRVPFTNVTHFSAGHMQGEKLYFDLATLCEQASLPIDEVRRSAARRATGTP